MNISKITNSIINTFNGVKTERSGIDKNGQRWKSYRYSIIDPPVHVTIKKLPTGTRVRSEYTGSGLLMNRQIIKYDGRQISMHDNTLTILEPFKRVKFMILEKAPNWKIKKAEIIPVGFRGLFESKIKKQLFKIR